ncbi:MAG TPA: metal-dependent transcriptional regulator [Candidatus Nanoarchaeia archaeon]|nr:metal-dependent transcriptional regulator [Candidatus Nanoarchaeia archaeon]
MTPAKEDYLRAIDHLQEKHKRNVKAIEVAKYMKLAKSTVSERLDELEKESLIKPKKYSSIELTKKGEKLARNLTYKHRIIEVFLRSSLKMKDVHEEAHKLEHAFSDSAIEKLKSFLKNPQYCPHGKPLPKIR